MKRFDPIRNSFRKRFHPTEMFSPRGWKKFFFSAAIFAFPALRFCRTLLASEGVGREKWNPSFPVCRLLFIRTGYVARCYRFRIPSWPRTQWKLGFPEISGGGFLFWKGSACCWVLIPCVKSSVGSRSFWCEIVRRSTPRYRFMPLFLESVNVTSLRRSVQYVTEVSVKCLKKYYSRYLYKS